MAIYVSLKERDISTDQSLTSLSSETFRRLSIIHPKEYDELCTSTTPATVPLTTTKR